MSCVADIEALASRNSAGGNAGIVGKLSAEARDGAKLSFSRLVNTRHIISKR